MERRSYVIILRITGSDTAKVIHKDIAVAVPRPPTYLVSSDFEHLSLIGSKIQELALEHSLVTDATVKTSFHHHK